MIVEHDGNGFVVLDRAACLELLARRHIAIVAITDGAMPLVLPALYGLWDDHVVMAVDPVGVLGRHVPNNIVSL
jgi:nitroimidazol reductase NimA-like FMN-containing flavoprotein (pyridoxamine 5'-phosphate oxidase superfamily)